MPNTYYSKVYQKRNLKKDDFIWKTKKNTFQVHLNFWLHFNNKTFSTPSFIEETRYQPLFLNSHTKLRFSFDNQYFYCIPPKNISYHNINHK